MYELIATHFLASLMGPMRYTEHSAKVKIAGEGFNYVWHQVDDEGFSAVAPYRRRDLRLNEIRMSLKQGEVVPVRHLELGDGWTEPPLPLKEKSQERGGWCFALHG